jgi:hypothetical protein
MSWELLLAVLGGCIFTATSVVATVRFINAKSRVVSTEEPAEVTISVVGDRVTLDAFKGSPEELARILEQLALFRPSAGQGEAAKSLETTATTQAEEEREAPKSVAAPPTNGSEDLPPVVPPEAQPDEAGSEPPVGDVHDQSASN